MVLNLEKPGRTVKDIAPSKVRIPPQHRTVERVLNILGKERSYPDAQSRFHWYFFPHERLFMPLDMESK